MTDPTAILQQHGWQMRQQGDRRIVRHPSGDYLEFYSADDLAAAAALVAARPDISADDLIAVLADTPAPPTDEETAICAACQGATAVAGPDAGGVFRRPPDMLEQAEIPVDQIVRGRFQPRQSFDDTSMAELAESIAAHGILNRLKVFANEAGQFELIAGERRWRAAQQLDMATVPVEIGEYMLAQIHEISIVDNLQREGLTPSEEGRAYERMIEELSISEAELARRIGKPRSYIQQRRALASASPAVAEALASGAITFSQARGICAGAPGHHLAQEAALESLHNRGSWHGPATEQEMQAYAEEAVLSTAKEALQDLGWKVERLSTGSDRPLTVVYTDRERPKAWTGAEILAALRDQRRPSESGEIPPAAAIIDADWTAIRRRGWELSDRQLAPWVVAKAPKTRFLTADEVPALVEQARKDLEDLRARYKAAGWTLKLRGSSESDSFDATTKQGRSEYLWSWATATQFIKKIEAGKEAREPNTIMRQCERCKETRPVAYHQYHYYCQDCIAALSAEEQRIRAELRQELTQIAGEWIAAAPAHILRLLAMEDESERLQTRRHMPPAKRSQLIRAADLAALRETLLDMLEESAYDWRDVDLGGQGERAVGAEGRTDGS